MRHSLILLGILFISSNLFAGTAVFFDVGTNKVTRYITRGYNEGATGPGIVINPDLSALIGIVPQRYWKHDSGSIVSMTRTEIEAETQTRVLASSSTVRARAKALLDNFSAQALILKAIMELSADGSYTGKTLKEKVAITKIKIDSGEAD